MAWLYRDMGDGDKAWEFELKGNRGE